MMRNYYQSYSRNGGGNKDSYNKGKNKLQALKQIAMQ